MKANVSLVRGQNRYANVAQALDLLSAQVNFQGCQQVLVKPNLVLPRRQLASTHVDAVRAVLDFVRARYDGKLIIAEGAALANTWEGFEHLGYTNLINDYDVTLVDLNADQVTPVQVYDRRLKPMTLRLARTVLASDLRISVGPPKTHNTVIVTLSLKNMIMGSLVNRSVAARQGVQQPTLLSRLRRVIPRPVRQWSLVQRVKELLPPNVLSDKAAMHQGYPVINLNLALLAPWVYPHLAVIDGFLGMEGDGPENGDPVNWQIALAGTDALAVDSLTTHLMSMDPSQVGYLVYCQRLGLGVLELDQINVLGDVAPDAVHRQFRRHPTHRQQREWRLTNVARWLQISSQEIREQS